MDAPYQWFGVAVKNKVIHQVVRANSAKQALLQCREGDEFCFYENEELVAIPVELKPIV